MRRTVGILLALCWLVLATPVKATVCSYDPAPAATLLFPFVAYDFNDPWHGETTIISITNLHHEAQVVKVSLWNDLGQPVLDFNVLLSGYDVMRFNMRDILDSGRIPVTVAEHFDSTEGVYPIGPVSVSNPILDWEPLSLEEPSSTLSLQDRCTSDHDGYPGNYNAAIPEAVLELLKSWLTLSQTAGIDLRNDCEPPYEEDGFPEPGTYGTWYFERSEQDLAWMYIIAEVVESCSRVRPTDAAYWEPRDEGGEARYDNVLMGDAMWVSSTSSTAMQAVHIEADEQLAQYATQNPETGLPISFHARFANALAGISDDREPLPTAWAMRYMGAESDRIDGTVLVWKGSTNYRIPFDLGVDFEDYNPQTIVASNANAYTQFMWDEDTNVSFSLSRPCDTHNWSMGIEGCPNLLPLVVQEISFDQFWRPPGDFGWALFVWPASNYDGNLAGRPSPDYYQTWMGTRHRAWGTHFDFLPALPVANYNCDSSQVLPTLWQP